MEELMIWRRFAASGGWWQVKIENHMTLQELLLLLLEKTVSRRLHFEENNYVVCIVMALLLTKGNKQPRSCTIAGLWCCILSASHKAINNNPRALRYAQAWEAWGFYHWGFNLQWIQQSEFWSDAAWMLSQCLIDEFWRWLPSSRTLSHFHNKLQSSKRNHSLQFQLSSFLWYHNDHDNQN